jgi:hypothetical protein
MVFSLLSASANKTNKIAKRGGRNKYIPLSAVYITNRTTYTNGVTGFL